MIINFTAAKNRHHARRLGIKVDLHHLDAQIADLEEKIGTLILRSESCHPSWLPGLSATVAELWEEREALEVKRERVLAMGERKVGKR